MYVTNTMVTTKIFLKDGNRINKMESSKMSLNSREDRRGKKKQQMEQVRKYLTR